MGMLEGRGRFGRVGWMLCAEGALRLSAAGDGAGRGRGSGRPGLGDGGRSLGGFPVRFLAGNQVGYPVCGGSGLRPAVCGGFPGGPHPGCRCPAGGDLHRRRSRPGERDLHCVHPVPGSGDVDVQPPGPDTPSLGPDVHPGRGRAPAQAGEQAVGFCRQVWPSWRVWSATSWDPRW